jgi:hypothetical protein
MDGRPGRAFGAQLGQHWHEAVVFPKQIVILHSDSRAGTHRLELARGGQDLDGGSPAAQELRGVGKLRSEDEIIDVTDETMVA